VWLSWSTTGCQPDCETIDSLFAEGFQRPDAPPENADAVWFGGDGGISIASDRRDPEVFEPLSEHLHAGTSTTPGRVRWSVILGLDRVLVVEHAMPLAAGDRIEIDTLLDDLVFTGGRGTRTWWDADWAWTAGSTTSASPRAVLTRAFESSLSTTSVEGSLEVRQTDPFEVRVGLSFQNLQGATETYWGDIEFDAAFGFEPCP